MNTIDLDDALKHHFKNYSKDNGEYWSFRNKATREHAHAYLQYPAMMVPKMQRELIATVCNIIPDTKSIYDPFMGSGTILTEAMIQGLDFTGQDINPLAVLICKAKKGPFYTRVIKEKINCLIRNIKEDKCCHIDIDFNNIFKWFCPVVALELSRIRRAIKSDNELWSRRFFWIALAETVRLTSNSRTSTFKLHIRPKEEIEARKVPPIKVFEEIIHNNYEKLCIIKQLLEQKELINHGHYKGVIKVELENSTSIKSNSHDRKLHDLLVTSPPYGDNATTVPYGQYSYLPLQWIDLNDIDENIDCSWLNTTHEIDTRSLGGRKEKALEEGIKLRRISKAFDQIIEDLKNEPRDRAIRVAAFCRDLNYSIDPILSNLKHGAYMIWTIGNRRVGNRLVPMDAILSDFLKVRGVKIVVNLQRTIPSKRMPIKNNIAKTMEAERIIIMKKGNA